MAVTFCRNYLWIIPVILASPSAATEYTKSADMEDGTTCDRLGGYSIGDSDIMQVYANPPQRPGGTATRDHCLIEVSAPKGRRLRLYIMDFRSADCGTRLEIYDGLTHMSSPSRVLKCGSEPIKIDSQFEGVRIRLVKQTPSANNYRVNIALTTDQGPDIDFIRDMATYASPLLSIEAIVGLSVAGILLLVAIIAIAIYCIVKQRKKNAEDEDDKPPHPESTVYSTGSSKVVLPAHDRDRYSKDRGNRSRDRYDNKDRRDNKDRSDNKDRYHNNRNRDSYESTTDSHNSSASSGEGRVFVNMDPNPKVKEKGHTNRAYVPSSEDGGNDHSRDSTGSEDTAGGYVNASFETNSDTPQRRRFNKNQETSHQNGRLSRSDRHGSARSKSNRKRNSSSDDNKGSKPHRSRSGSGSRSGHRDSSRRRSRSNGERGGSQRRSRSRSPHSQTSNQSTFDSKGHNRKYDISSLSKRSRESSNSSTSSRDSGEDSRAVSYNPAGRRGRERTRNRDREDEYGSQV